MALIGFVVNPIAGMGGRVGLKGTDEMAEEARRRGAEPVAHARARAMLGELQRLLRGEPERPSLDWVTCRGPMGADVIPSTSIPPSAAQTKKAVSSFVEAVVLNANYLRVSLQSSFKVPFNRPCMHEFVCEGRLDDSPVRAVDIAKRLIDDGIHLPTNYFPLIVREALMIEPAETENKPTLDAFVGAMAAIAAETRDRPELLRSATHTTPAGRLDEVKAARELELSDPAAATSIEELPSCDR